MNVLCSCVTFVSLVMGVHFPSWISTSDPHIHPGKAHVGEIVIFWQPLQSEWHVGIDEKDTTDGFYMASTNAHGCGLFLDYMSYSDPRYSGVWQ